MRKSVESRNTFETQIQVELNLDGSRQVQADTGIGFFDHMLTAMAFHGGFDLTVQAAGDLAVDGHHTVEDVGIVLGKALASALGDKVGIRRYGSAGVPMDEALAQCNLDISGRSYLVWNVPLAAPMVGAFDTQLAKEFFQALAANAGITLHINLAYGQNDHHKLEAVSKAVGQSLRQAVEIVGQELPSTKGAL